MDGRKTNKLPDGVGKKIIEALKNQSEGFDYQQEQQYQEQYDPQTQYAQNEQQYEQQDQSQYNQQYVQQYQQQMPEQQYYQPEQDDAGYDQPGYGSINPNAYMNVEQTEESNWTYDDTDSSYGTGLQEPEYQSTNYVDEQYNVPEQQYDYSGHSYEETYAKEAREIERFSYDNVQEEPEVLDNTISDSYDFYGQMNYAQDTPPEQQDYSYQQPVQQPAAEQPVKRFSAFKKREEEYVQPVQDHFVDNFVEEKPSQKPQPQTSASSANIDLASNNVDILMRLVSQLPAGVTRQTGAQIIRQTMEALGVPMNNVLKEAQETQDNFARAIKNNMNRIEEYRNNIKILEGEVQNYRKESDKLEDLISLFILSEEDFNK